MSDYEEETDWAFKGACTSDCTQRTDGVCDGTFLEQVIQGPSIKYAFCNDKWLLVLSSGEGGVFEPHLNNVPSPPLGTSDGVTYCTGDPARTVDRYYSLQYPLDVVDFDEGVYTNNVDLFDGSSGSDAIDYAYDDGTGIGTYGLPGGRCVGITVNGMQDWVTQNNRGEWNQPTCEASPCNLHVGQGAARARALRATSRPSSDSHQCLYGTSNYTSTASHPPIVGFGADGHLIYGRYLGDDAPGFADPLLDECSGHTHVESTTSTSGRRSASSRVLCVSSPVTRFAPRSHYHTQIFGYTCGTEGSQDRCDDGDEVVISTTGPLFCFRADLSQQEGSSALLSFTTSDDYLSASDMSYACCDMTDYYVVTGNVFTNMDSFVADGTTGNGCHVTCDDGYAASGVARCVEGAFAEYATCVAGRDAAGAPSPAPSSAPSAAPSALPSPAPTAPADEATSAPPSALPIPRADDAVRRVADSTSFFYKKSKYDCDYVAKKSSRCKSKNTDEGDVSSVDACPVARRAATRKRRADSTSWYWKKSKRRLRLHREEVEAVQEQLVDGPDAYSGTIYVLNPHTNTWGNARRRWGPADADVVCRQVFGTDYQAYMATANNYFGSAANDGNFVYDDVGCYGYENYLAACTYTHTHNCGNGEQAGVICVTPTPNPTPLPTPRPSTAAPSPAPRATSASFFYKKSKYDCDYVAKKSSRCKSKNTDEGDVSSVDACPSRRGRACDREAARRDSASPARGRPGRAPSTAAARRGKTEKKMFAQYKDELGHVLRQSAEKLSVAGGYADDPARELDLLRECDGLLGQAGDLAKQLGVEPRCDRRRERQEGAAGRGRAAPRDPQDAPAVRAGRARGGGAAGRARRRRQRRVRWEPGRLADANARAQQQTDLIRGALEIAHDTEQVAVDISGELERNRETIGNIRGHIADTSGSLGALARLISPMQKREVQQKAILTVVAAILIGAVGAVSYYPSTRKRRA
ncbi:hypothetical protein SO694_00005163 [Aureococcus anophagefferens]|uniref:SRCR domain-containing protein n=1 Tax=Aureococcus anophagefferens TaxID=44056 RepID=A0ABR1G951_AURAN